MFARVKHPCQRPPVTLHGVGFDILVGSENRVGLAAVFPEMILRVACRARSSRAARPAFARWALAWQPSLRNGLPSRTDLRTGGEGVRPRSLIYLTFFVRR